MAIVRNKGYVQLRRGLFEHVQNGEMSWGECFLYVAILTNADPATGVWFSSAGMLASFYSIPERTCRDWLTKLENKRYLRRFMVHGRHLQYPILIHKFDCTDGAMKGMRLNAWESTSCEDLKYEPCPDGCRDGAGEGAMTVPESTRELKNGEEGTKPKASPSASSLPDWIPMDAWNAFVQMRKAERHPLTPTSIKLAINKLEKLRAEGQDIRVVLEESAFKGYRGLWPVNGNGNGHATQTKPKTKYDLDLEAQLEERNRLREEFERTGEIK